jgi:hypothetical protein
VVSTSDWLALTGVVVAVIAIGATYHVAGRRPRVPRFQVSHQAQPRGWALTGHNVGTATAALARFELVGRPGGTAVKLLNEAPEGVQVAIGGVARAGVTAGRRETGLGVDLVWCDAQGDEHREHVALPAGTPEDPPRSFRVPRR